MGEYIRASALGFNEPETLGVIEPFHRTNCHDLPLELLGGNQFSGRQNGCVKRSPHVKPRFGLTKDVQDQGPDFRRMAAKSTIDLLLKTAFAGQHDPEWRWACLHHEMRIKSIE